MTGLIVLWSGVIVDIPNGWALCDGSNGTPDLRERFVRGSPAGINPGGIGGASCHSHAYSGDVDICDVVHSHDFCGDTYEPSGNCADYSQIEGIWLEYGCHTHPFEGQTEDGGCDHYHSYSDVTSGCSHLPPYYNIVFIMKE